MQLPSKIDMTVKAVATKSVQQGARAMNMEIDTGEELGAGAAPSASHETDKTIQKKFAAAMLMLRDTPRDAWVNVQTASDALQLGATSEEVLALYLAKKKAKSRAGGREGEAPASDAEPNGVMLALSNLLSIWITIEDKKPIFRIRNNGVYMPPNYIRDWVKHAVAHPATPSGLRHRFMRYVASIESALHAMSPRNAARHPPRARAPASAPASASMPFAPTPPSTPRASVSKAASPKRQAESQFPESGPGEGRAPKRTKTANSLG